MSEPTTHLWIGAWVILTEDYGTLRRGQVGVITDTRLDMAGVRFVGLAGVHLIEMECLEENALNRTEVETLRADLAAANKKLAEIAAIADSAADDDGMGTLEIDDLTTALWKIEAIARGEET